MLLLAIDTTTTVCSVALGDEEKIWGEYSLNLKRTHSQQLMPIIVSLFHETRIEKEMLQGIAVTIGPGSFTGIRIGMATAMGLAQGLGISLVGVMTLDALAEAGACYPVLICPLLDARKDQVYTALYRGGEVKTRMVEPASAFFADDLLRRLEAYEEKILFLGDPLEKIREKFKLSLGQKYLELPYSLSTNRASLVLRKGIRNWNEKGVESLYALRPFYLRLPEAERRLEKRMEGEQE